MAIAEPFNLKSTLSRSSSPLLLTRILASASSPGQASTSVGMALMVIPGRMACSSTPALSDASNPLPLNPLAVTLIQVVRLLL